MKKVFLFLMACCLSLTMSARVAYLVPVAQRVDMGCQECDLPYEACDNGEQSPERRAFKWFRDDYTGEKTVLYLNDLANIPADVNAIWIHVDRVGFNTAAFDAVFTSEVKENLKAFVNRGGNVFLAKQATRLEYDLVNAKHFLDDNRAELDYGDGGYVGAQTWGASILFYATNNDDDNNNHRVWGSYANHAMFKNAPHRSDSYLEYVWSDGKQITDHNSGFPIGQMNMNGTDWRLELWGFQQKNNCRVIGGWANGDGCHYGGIVEFYPTASRKGTVVMVGLAAYQWINNNAGNGFANVKKSTEDLLKYLDNKAVKGRNQDKLMTDIFAEDWCYPASLETENHEFRIIHPNIDGWTMSSWIPEDQRSIADIRYIERSAEDKHDRIEFYQEGTVDLHIKLTEDREFQAWPKGDYEFVRKVKFTYSSSAQAVVDADLSSNGLDGETGNFMLLHPNMRGLDSLAYAISFDGIEEANRAEVKKIKDGGATRLVFTKAGTVKLNIRLNEPNYREEWAKGEHNVVKTVTFAQPAFTWSHTPDVAALNEDKPAVVVTCDNVPGVTVKYESSDPAIAAVNETTGKISYIKEGTCQINAYIEINGVKFESSKENVTVNGLNITWTTAPAETAKVGDEMTIAAAPQYGSATILYETVNCSYADGKLSFTHDGIATVRPYAEVNGTTYYGEQKTITVSYAQDQPDLSMETIPAKVWDLFPVTLPETLNGLSVTYSINNERAMLADRVLTYASAGEVTLTATYVESSSTAPWPTGTYTNTKTIMMAGYGEVALDADIAYLLPESLDALEAIEEKAEYNAAKWFMETYIGADKKGKFVKDLSDLTDIKTLWINVERVGITTDYAVLADNADEVEAFVKAGGNVLLTKQATRLSYTSGRMPLEPNFEAGAYFEEAGENEGGKMFYRERSIATKMGTRADQIADRSKNRLYNLMLYWDGQKNVYMVAPNVKKTNNYCGWQDLEKNTEKSGKADNTKIACLNDFEDAWNCEVLGVKGHIEDYCYADVVDFAPKGDYTGRIIAVGSSAYQWGESNRTSAANAAKEYRNVKQFTKNAIAYLHGDPLEIETYVRTATAGNYSTICYPFEIQMVEGATVYDLVCMSQSGSSVILEEVDGSLKPGKSYIFMPEQSEVTFYYSGGCVEVLDHSNGMYGNILNDVIKVDANDNNYILYQNNMYYVDTENVYIQQYRAYIKLNEVDGYKEPSTPEQAARRRSMGIQGAPSVTTGVANINGSNAQDVHKVMMDGALYIMRDGKMYNVQGQIVK